MPVAVSAPGPVLHVVERCLGGTAAYVAGLMARQAAAGDRPPLLAADPALIDPRLRDLDIIAYGSGRGFGAVGAARRVQAIVAATRPALVHLHSTFAGVYGRLFASPSPDAPAIVYCPHGWAFEMTAGAPRLAFYRWAERRLAPRADVIVSISETERLAALAAGLPEAGHLAIPHGLGPERPGPRPAALDPARLNLLFVGRFGPQKGLDLLLAALARTARPDVALHVIGAADLGVDAQYDFSDPRVRVHGWIAPDALDAWYAAADALVMPSRWEGFGLVAIEAMRAGTAVLASDRGALPEVIGQDAGRLFDPEDAAGLARRIDGLDRTALARMGAAGRTRFEARFSAARADAALDAAYEMALERRRRRR